MARQPKIAAIVPARMASTRFPGKPLIPVLGLPMIEHVRRRLDKLDFFDQVIVATCDNEIRSVVEKSGGTVIMTDPSHPGGTDRVAEAATKVDADIILNVQGDEPMLLADDLRLVIDPFFEDTSTYITNLILKIHTKEDLHDDSVVKTVLSKSNQVLYFSRSAVPGREFKPGFSYYKQAGICGFKKKALAQYQEIGRTQLEAKEGIDMLRFLECDIPIRGVVSDFEVYGIDLPEHVAKVEKHILSNPTQKAVFESIMK